MESQTLAYESTVSTTTTHVLEKSATTTTTLKQTDAERLLIAPHSRRNKLRIEAHRGFGRYEPENTLQAFARAMDEQLDGIELDVWLTKDRVPVIIHTGSYEEEGYIRFDDGSMQLVYEMTLRELRSKKILKGHMIPTLDEVLRLTKGRICVNIEFKGEDHEVVPVVLKAVKDQDMLEQVHFSSFYWDFCKTFRLCIKAQEIETKVPFSFLIWEPEALENGNPFLGQEGDGITLEWTLLETHRDLVKNVAEEAMNRGYKLKIYYPFSNIEDFEGYKTLEELGVDTVITNEPFLMRDFYQDSRKYD